MIGPSVTFSNAVVQALERAGAEEEPNEKIEWQEELLDRILKMSSSAFERLVQRLLRESGFIQVEVTGQSGDGGVDGHGILRLGGLLSFHVIKSTTTGSRVCDRVQAAAEVTRR
jgi:restriction system protein